MIWAHWTGYWGFIGSLGGVWVSGFLSYIGGIGGLGGLGEMGSKSRPSTTSAQYGGPRYSMDKDGSLSAGWFSPKLPSILDQCENDKSTVVLNMPHHVRLFDATQPSSSRK
jgi:hypothetical protein